MPSYEDGYYWGRSKIHQDRKWEPIQIDGSNSVDRRQEVIVIGTDNSWYLEDFEIGPPLMPPLE